MRPARQEQCRTVARASHMPPIRAEQRSRQRWRDTSRPMEARRLLTVDRMLGRPGGSFDLSDAGRRGAAGPRAAFGASGERVCHERVCGIPLMLAARGVSVWMDASSCRVSKPVVAHHGGGGLGSCRLRFGQPDPVGDDGWRQSIWGVLERRRDDGRRGGISILAVDVLGDTLTARPDRQRDAG